MAHDRQLAENNLEASEVSKPSKTLSDTVADWLTLYGQTYREEITEELALLYQEALKDICPEILHRAFLKAAKTCKFRPTPAEVRNSADSLMSSMQRGNRPKYLDEPMLSEAEREATLADPSYQELRGKILGSVR
jgi:hypothetical protein